MKKPSSFERNLTFAHLQGFLWVIVFLLFFFFMLYTDPWEEALNDAITTTGSYLIIIYGNVFWLMPYFYKEDKKYLAHLSTSIFLLVLISYLRVELHSYFWNILFPNAIYIPGLKDYAQVFVSHSLVFISSIVFRFAIDFFKVRRQQDLLLKEHALAQLNLLKAQVQPHFLFNTLNNIYFFAQKESPVTADLLEKLSAMIRYFLDEGPRQRVLFQSELEFITIYIELEKMRIRYPLRIEVALNGNYETVKIPPMLLIPLVENVFKHGIDKSRDDNYITISLHVAETFSFTVRNKVPSNPQTRNESKGSGLQNLRNRLTILYPDNFTLDTSEIDGIFTSRISIPYET
jgi:hypothetical protein